MDSGQLTLYRGCTPVVDAEYGRDSDATPTEAVIDALVAASGASATELPPLYEAIDTDALNQMFHDHDGVTDSEATLSFQVDTWNVFVRADGRIRVCDATQPTDPTPVFESNPA